MKGQVQNMTLLFGSLTPPCSLSCPEADGKAMEKPWFRQAPGTAQRHSDIPKGTNSGTSVLFPQSSNHLLFLTFNGQLYSFQMFFSPGGIEGQQVRSIWRASSSLLLQYDCVAAVLTHALRLLCQDQSDQQGRFSL